MGEVLGERVLWDGAELLKIHLAVPFRGKDVKLTRADDPVLIVKGTRLVLELDQHGRALLRRERLEE